MSIKINGKDFAYDDSQNASMSVVEFVHKYTEDEVPTMCFLKSCGNVQKCGLCSVLVNGKKTLACNTTITDGDVIETAYVFDNTLERPAHLPNENAPELAEFLQKRVGMMLDKHNFACGKCPRKSSCEFLDLVKLTKARPNTPYRPTPQEVEQAGDYRSVSIHLDRTKCVQCARCAAACAFNTSTNSIFLGKLPDAIAEKTGKQRGICPALDGVMNEKSFDENNCLLCGQCVLACPVGCLTEKDDTEKVLQAIADPKKLVIVAPAPSVRASLGEEFGLPFGTDVTGKMYSALRELGFNKVLDINFAADVTIMEEGTELLGRLANKNSDSSNNSNYEYADEYAKFPMLTSCCPGWQRLVDNFAPELLPNLSSAKSPQQIFGAAAKYYYPQSKHFPEGFTAEDIFVVTIMPCIAKKDEATMGGMSGASGNELNPDVDAVLSVRELARMIKSAKIDFANLDDSQADSGLGEYTGAATIFGVTGGVMEAALRSAKDIAQGADLSDVDYESVQGFCGVREAEVEINGNILKVAVVNGAANFFKFKDAKNESGVSRINDYHFIEVMACPGGCINGGGQPHVDSHTQLDAASGKDGDLSSCSILSHNAGFSQYLPEYVAKRASVLRKQDSEGNFTDKKRKSHQNAEVQEMYDKLNCAPGSGIAHKLFHVDHKTRRSMRLREGEYVKVRD